MYNGLFSRTFFETVKIRSFKKAHFLFQTKRKLVPLPGKKLIAAGEFTKRREQQQLSC